MKDVSLATAARIELALAAHAAGDVPRAVGLLLAVPAPERAAAMAWLRQLGADPTTLLAGGR